MEDVNAQTKRNYDKQFRAQNQLNFEKWKKLYYL